jgi:DinB superfamily/Pentapeptide repeats (8 copies)
MILMDDFTGSRFTEADFSDSQFRGVVFSNVKIADSWLVDVDISGHINGLTVNGVDVTEFVERQLDERHPTRRLLTAADPEGMRQAWIALQQEAASTLDRARKLPTEALNRRVDEEWSYLQTLRHLVYAADRWISGPVLADAHAFHPLGMPNPPIEEIPVGVFDLDASPDLEAVLLVRHDRMNRVSTYLATVTPEQLDAGVESPNGGNTTVRRCLHVVFREEWWHNQYANRDLAIIERHGSAQLGQ